MNKQQYLRATIITSLIVISMVVVSGALAASALTTTLSVWYYDGNIVNGEMVGYAASTAGDVNGDGYADVIVGGPGYESGLGEAFAFHGGPGGLSDISAWEVNGIKGSRFGYAVSTVGDVSNDGIDDVVVGAPYYRPDEYEYQVGAVFVYHGSPGTGSSGGLSTTPGWQFFGTEKKAELGISVSSGDINGDTYSDIIVGAGKAGEPDKGSVFIFYGSDSGISSVVSQTLQGNQTSALFGQAVSTAGDVNCDGVDDVIIGAPGYDLVDGDVLIQTVGAVFVYFGDDTGTGLGSTPDWSFIGDQAGASLGAAVGSAGDVNNDGCDDIVAGAPYYKVGEESKGAAFVFYGSGTGLHDTPQWQAFGDSGEDTEANPRFGISVTSAGDMDGDGYDDLIIGADRFDKMEQGAAYVYFGGPGGLAQTPGWYAEGGKAETGFGFATGAAGDVDQDGFADVIIGAPGFKTDEKTPHGRAFVYFGSENPESSPGLSFQVYLPVILRN